MHITRIAEAPEYDGPGHHGMTALRMQGLEASQTGAFWVGLSRFQPGGGVEWDIGVLEKVYVVVDGEVTLITEDGETTLAALDSCHIPAGEGRALENRSDREATMLVILPTPPAAQ